MKVSELEGAKLDYWVAKAEGYVMERAQDLQMVHRSDPMARILVGPGDSKYAYSPSTDWQQGGPIIERESISIMTAAELDSSPRKWAAWVGDPPFKQDEEFTGPTALIAAMRAYVASKFGEEAPDESQ